MSINEGTWPWEKGMNEVNLTVSLTYTILWYMFSDSGAEWVIPTDLNWNEEIRYLEFRRQNCREKSFTKRKFQRSAEGSLQVFSTLVRIPSNIRENHNQKGLKEKMLETHIESVMLFNTNSQIGKVHEY